MAPPCFQTCNKEPKLCVVSHLTEFFYKTKSYRVTGKSFLSCIDPYRAVIKDAISRWCKSIIKESGISVNYYTSYSSADAASSYVKFWGALLSQLPRLRVRNRRGHSLSFTKNKSKTKLSFKIICCKTIKLYKRFVKVYRKNFYRALIVKKLHR